MTEILAAKAASMVQEVCHSRCFRCGGSGCGHQVFTAFTRRYCFPQAALMGGLEFQTFPMKTERIIISLEKTWESKKVVDFLLSRPMITKVTWNQKDYFPPEADEL